MIIQEQINNLLYTHSDSNFYILQNETNIKYDEEIPKREEEDNVSPEQE